MSRFRFRLCLYVVGWFLASPATGQHQATQPPAAATSQPSPDRHHATPSQDCLDCHNCPQPTAESPCLRTCTRPTATDLGRILDQARGPSVVLLDELEDRFLPVPFDHAGHARMAKMTQGCVVCHHHTPENTEHPACQTCHEKSSKREDIHKPGLKGAYHRQCMSCHREWSGESQCDACHLPKTNRSLATTAASAPSAGDIVGRMHPPIPEPDTEIYRAFDLSKPGGESKVIFRHREHVHRFGLNCVDCHQEDNCLRCHANGRQHVQQVRTVTDHHQPCARCHEVKNETGCQRCHWSEGQPMPPPFDHASTGWTLNRHHAGLTCRTCHEAVPFRRLDNDCTACHSWEPGEFEHGRLTGLVLNDSHAGIDCTDCHTKGNYEAAIRCTECHDEDIRYPESMPGTRWPTEATEKPAGQ
jgi:hypothetical protein